MRNCLCLYKCFNAKAVKTFTGGKGFGGETTVQRGFNAQNKFAAELLCGQRFEQFGVPDTEKHHHRFSGARGQFHAGFDSEVVNDALDDHAQVPRSGVAVAIEHPGKGFFAQAGLSRRFFETDFCVDQIAQYGKPNSSFSLQSERIYSIREATETLRSPFLPILIRSR